MYFFSSVQHAAVIVVVSSSLCFLLLLRNGGAQVVASPNKTGLTFPALFVFGDSILDTGNNNYLLTEAKCNFPPYGKDFIGHQPTGRFSNGKVPSDFAASILGIKETLPPYLFTELSNEDLLTGVCFASGGAGYDPLTSKIANAISLPKQLELFNSYKEKLQTITDADRAATIVGESLYVLCTGNNDLANTYFGPIPARSAHYDIHEYIALLIRSASSLVEDLYNMGARKIVVAGLPPVGCLPSQRTIAGGPQRECADKYNQASQEFNSALVAELQQLRKKLSIKTIIYVDIYNELLRLIEYPSEYGFVVSNKGCCGTGKLEVTFLCNKFTPTCADDTKYVFWDSYHPTEKAYRILTAGIVQQAMSAMF